MTLKLCLNRVVDPPVLFRRVAGVLAKVRVWAKQGSCFWDVGTVKVQAGLIGLKRIRLDGLSCDMGLGDKVWCLVVDSDLSYEFQSKGL